MDCTHPFRVTLGKVFVDSDDMDTLACQGIQINCHDRCQCLSFTGFHFRNIAVMHDSGADQLHRIRVFPDDSVTCLSCGGESFHIDIIERSTIRQLLLQLRRHRLQILITHLSVCFFQVKDWLNPLFKLFQFTAVFIEKF